MRGPRREEKKRKTCKKNNVGSISTKAKRHVENKVDRGRDQKRGKNGAQSDPTKNPKLEVWAQT